MKLLIDNMLSPWIAAELTAAGYDAVHVRDLGMSAASDSAILTLAKEEDRVIVSADLDFANLLATQRRTNPSLLLLRDMPRSREAILELLVRNLPTPAEAITKGAVVSFRQGGFRVRRLPIFG